MYWMILQNLFWNVYLFWIHVITKLSFTTNTSLLIEHIFKYSSLQPSKVLVIFFKKISLLELSVLTDSVGEDFNSSFSLVCCSFHYKASFFVSERDEFLFFKILFPFNNFCISSCNCSNAQNKSLCKGLTSFKSINHLYRCLLQWP